MSAPYRTVLCPTDLSAAGDEAVRLAYSVVKDGGIVHVLHIVEPGVVALPFDLTPVMIMPPDPEVREAETAAIAKHLKALEPSAPARGVRTDTHILTDVGPSAVIRRIADELKVDAIVMGTNGRSGLGKLLMGSVASAVMNHVSIPVLLVRMARAKP